MLKYLISVLFSIWLAVVPALAMPGMPTDTYVAVFTSFEFTSDWRGKYQPDFKFIYNSWSDFPYFLDEAVKRAEGKKLIVDIDCHGYTDSKHNNDGFYIFNLDTGKDEVASMGYVSKRIDEKLANRPNTIVLTEACYSGNVYYSTIRNNKSQGVYIENYNQIPKVPIYGVGSGFTNMYMTMFFQVKHNFHLWYYDLRCYEKFTPNNPEPWLNPNDPGMSLTTAAIQVVDKFIMENF